MKYAFIQNPLNKFQFFAQILNSFIISHLLELSNVRQLIISYMVVFDQCGVITACNNTFDPYLHLRFLIRFRFLNLIIFCSLSGVMMSKLNVVSNCLILLKKKHNATFLKENKLIFARKPQDSWFQDWLLTSDEHDTYNILFFPLCFQVGL